MFILMLFIKVILEGHSRAIYHRFDLGFYHRHFSANDCRESR